VIDVIVMDLETRLDSFLEDNPDRFTDDVVGRVREVACMRDKGGRDSYHLFRELDDWTLYHRLHPDWQGMSPSEINRSSNRAIKQFYDSLLIWCNAKVKGNDRESRKKRNQMKRQVLQYKKPSYHHLKTLDRWIDAKQDNPAWKDATSRQMQRNEVEGGNMFYRHCREFVDSITDSKLEQKEMMAEVFKPQYTYRNYTSVSDWKDEYDKRFAGYLISQLEDRSVPGGAGYVLSLRRWLKKMHPESSRKRSFAMRKIFKNYHHKRRKSPKR